MPGFKKPLLTDSALAKSPFYIKYGVPLLLTVIVTIIKISLTNYIGQKTPFLLYFGVVIITSRYFGKTPAIVITLLSAIAANTFFISPVDPFVFNNDALLQVAIFIGECSLLIALSNALSKAVTIINEKDIVFKTLVEKSSEGIITVNADGKITYCSPSVQNIIGYTGEEFMSLPAWQLLHEDEALEVKEQYYRFAAHPGKHITMTHQMRHKNGDYIWIESKMSNLLGEPPINAVIANFTDISDRIFDNKLREDFIGIASHELKTPLTSLKAYTQVLQNRFRDNTDETSLNIVNKIEVQVTKVIQMVTNLLDITSLQQKKLILNIGLFDLNLLISEIVDTLQSTTKKHNIITELVPVPDIWGDKERITQVIINLVSNAIKYSPDANTVTISSKVENGSVILLITDQGIGIPKNDLKRVFARFYRVHNTSKNFQGLGLGLFICSQIVEHHGGEIGVESEVGQGSTFWFSLPLSN
ncbi:MAG: ATP-binding protein [Mucilaginibacter sp.]|uniref:PAS domain-containing sensor histidine kinase n=1 Tax=Mucilaginibacter sp. TaxID=1882438 RepID=UPI0032653FB2